MPAFAFFQLITIICKLDHSNVFKTSTLISALLSWMKISSKLREMLLRAERNHLSRF